MTYADHLEHYGIFGQKWGVRRYQNSDGSLTEAGKKRYNSQTRKLKKLDKKAGKKERAYEKYTSRPWLFRYHDQYVKREMNAKHAREKYNAYLEKLIDEYGNEKLKDI